MATKRKTRNDKIISDLRRQLATTRETTVQTQEIVPTTKSYSVPVSTLPEKPTVLPSQIPLALVKKDLTKTLALTLLAISLELVLYFLLG